MTLLALLFLLGQAGGQNPQGSTTELTPPLWVVLRAAMNPTATYCSTTPGGGLNEAMTFTRGTTGYINQSSSVISQCASGNIREDINGYLSENQTFNECFQSQTFDNGTWVKTNVTVTANTSVAPDGTTTADQLAGTANGGTVAGNQISATAVVYTGSVWWFTTASTQSARLAVHDYTSVSDLCTVDFTATTTATRSSCTTAAATAGHNIGLVIYPGNTGATGTIIAWGAQLETGAWPSSYSPTTTARLAHNTDTAYLLNPLQANDTAWCLAITYLPPPPTNAWDLQNQTQGLFEMSSGTHNTANNFEGYVKAGGTIGFDIRDNSNALKTYTIPKPSTGSHRITFCQDGAAGITMYTDGAAQTVTPTGAGTGISSAVPTRIYIGILTSSSASGGQVKNFALSRIDSTYVGQNL